MRDAGMMPPPAVHMLMDDLDPPYVGYVSCRPFYRGADAVQAIARLGTLPAALYATRLVFGWEHADLMTALEMPGDPFPTALVTVEATFTGHTLSWYPLDITWGPRGSVGVPTVRPTWGVPVVHDDTRLPAPVEAALARWRALSKADIEKTATKLQRDGYHVRLVDPPA